MLFANSKIHNVMIETSTTSQQETKKSGKSRRGFASMDKDLHKNVSSKGGKAVRSSYARRTLSVTPQINASPVN